LSSKSPVPSSFPVDPLMAAGGCHCGAVRFTVRIPVPEIIVCNCSICSKKGFLHLIAEHDQLTIHQGLDQLTDYRFNTRTAQHLFCTTCGMHPFYVPRSHPHGWSVNARCLDDVGIAASLPMVEFDGLHWEQHIDEIRS